MRMKQLSTFLSLLVMALGSVPVRGAASAEALAASPRVLALKALSENPSEAAESISALRALGPAGLGALFEAHRQTISSHTAEIGPGLSSDPEWRRLAVALDAVSQQRDSFASHLYWYTDIEQAKAAARSSGKPILSLRLLGNLNEEFSCANSRFFRSILYANQEVSAYLREHFVLHWKSVRPAPRVCIDFGDGRKIEGTLTGNSIHYILDTAGRPIDAIPGLYGPAAFLRELAQAEGAFRLASATSGAEREAALRRYHQACRAAIDRQLLSDTARAGISIEDIRRSNDASASGTRNRYRPGPETTSAGGPDDPDRTARPPTARQAGALAFSKSVVETKRLRSIGEGARVPTPAGAETDLAAWQKIADLHSDDARIDRASIALIRSHYTAVDAGAAGRIARIIQNLEGYVAMDTVRNEYLMHYQLHGWFADGWANRDVDTLNERVYAQLFLTPRSDPWLGLLSPETYSGLENDGVVVDR
jgi:hypothetical protein